VEEAPKSKKTKKRHWKPQAEGHVNPVIGYWYNLYHRPTETEVAFEPAIASLGIPYRFQHIVSGKFILDFALTHEMINIEVDGRSHDEFKQQVKDLIKTRFLKEKGWRTIRIKNEWVMKDPYKAADYLMMQLGLPYRTRRFDDFADYGELRLNKKG